MSDQKAKRLLRLATLLQLDDEWRTFSELDLNAPGPQVAAALVWLRNAGLVESRKYPNSGADHHYREWAASDSGLAIADAVRDGDLTESQALEELGKHGSN